MHELEELHWWRASLPLSKNRAICTPLDPLASLVGVDANATDSSQLAIEGR